jgi:uncharacterized membrane protein SpoIIM required for sporulation
MALAVAMSGLGTAVGYVSFVPEPDSGAVYALSGSGLDIFGQILGRNLSAALLLFSGFVTVGTTTLLGLIFVSAWVGAGWHALASTSRLGEVDPLVLTYIPLEFGGLLLAATAGLMPLVAAAQTLASGGRSARPALARPALACLALAITLIVCGAAVETIVIQTIQEHP